MPIYFKEEFICDVLGITLTELYKQPNDWVERMLILKGQKVQAEEWLNKKQQQQSNQNINH